MNRTKVTVACKACQKKKVKCTGISPCTNCIRAGHRCEFTGTAKKRGPRNGNVEVIKSSARRIENVLRKNPEYRGQIEQMLAHGNTRSSIHSARPTSIPPNAPIVIIDDDNTGVTVDASQSHGIPRNYGSPSQFMRAGIESPVLRKPIPLYPNNMRSQNHVTPITPTTPKSTLPISAQRKKFSLPSLASLTLPTPKCMARKKATDSMPIYNITSGLEVLLPAAPDLKNPLDAAVTSRGQTFNDTSNPFPSPPQSLVSIKPQGNKSYFSPPFNPPTPASSSPASSPRNSDKILLSRPVWENNANNMEIY